MSSWNIQQMKMHGIAAGLCILSCISVSCESPTPSFSTKPGPVFTYDEDKQPAWSPDGARIAFVSSRDSIRTTATETGVRQVSYFEALEIYVMHQDGSNQTRVTDNGVREETPAWSPDGSKLAFTINQGICLVNADGSNFNFIASGNTGSNRAAWSPDGMKIAFSSYTPVDSSSNIFTINIDGSGKTNITPSGYEQSIRSRYRDLAWSPDGSRIAFVHDRNIYIMQADGTEPKQITHGGMYEFISNPAWSPDGSRIAFVRSGSIYLMNSDGSSQVRLPTAGYNNNPAWSPDGRKIAFDSDRDGNYEIYTMNADGSNQTRLTFNE